eukprot:CAMPEP_0168561218 /NCGR_PEP_ID=MMETSP0413-20121227/11476_1 /TAXON_ID=136452 /ORGANISM="Filamoeba nolandi, Strain NC-AS-23-1" /LENGTH=259 /DNA_ID=CAMNT_0008592571 /DNA_START=582 /DNA_END=1362 /DNA_ORIENTATION=-
MVDDLSCQISRIFGKNLKIGYTFGSRLYGNATKSSDFDYIVLMDGSTLEQSFDEEMLQKENAELRSMKWFFDAGWFPEVAELTDALKDQRFMFIDEAYYQAWVLNENSFKIMLSHCVPLAVECLSLELMFSQDKKPHNCYEANEEGLKGSPFVFHHRELVKPGCKLSMELRTSKYSPSQIYQSFGLPAKRMWELVKHQLDNLAADPMYSDENSEVAISPLKFHAIEKHMYNSFRILVFGIQVAKFGCITNFKASNTFRA